MAFLAEHYEIPFLVRAAVSQLDDMVTMNRKAVRANSAAANFSPPFLLAAIGIGNRIVYLDLGHPDEEQNLSLGSPALAELVPEFV